jgi:hypothetical protein
VKIAVIATKDEFTVGAKAFAGAKGGVAGGGEVAGIGLGTTAEGRPGLRSTPGIRGGLSLTHNALVVESVVCNRPGSPIAVSCPGKLPISIGQRPLRGRMEEVGVRLNRSLLAVLGVSGG